MLNNRGLRTRAGAYFQLSNILRIIRHEGYTGYIITKNARSEYIPELQIIDQETFEKANDIISRRSARQRKNRRIAHTSQNPTLLAGIDCAHCGAKMSGFMTHDRYKLADGSTAKKSSPSITAFSAANATKAARLRWASTVPCRESGCHRLENCRGSIRANPRHTLFPSG